MAQRSVRPPACRRRGQCHWLLSICDGLGQIVGEEEHVIHDLETERLEMTTRRDRFESSERRDPRLLRPERRSSASRDAGSPSRRGATLEELVILAIAIAIVGKVPMVHHAPVLHVDHRLDARIDDLVHGLDLGPSRRAQFEGRRFGKIDRAFGREALAARPRRAPSTYGPPRLQAASAL